MRGSSGSTNRNRPRPASLVWTQRAVEFCHDGEAPGARSGVALALHHLCERGPYCWVAAVPARLGYGSCFAGGFWKPPAMRTTVIR